MPILLPIKKSVSSGNRLWLIVLLILQCSWYSNGQTILCPQNIDFSFGNLNNWTCYTGTSQSTFPAGTLPAFANPTLTAPITGPPSRHLITTGSGTDPYGGFSVVAPGGGLFSLKLGNSNTGSGAERIRCLFHVPIGFNNYSLNFKYAVVLNDTGHPAYNRPAFTVIGYDSATGNPLPCATLSYNSGSAGLLTSPLASDVRYLPWTNGSINLTGQGGKTIAIEVTSYDCADGNHFGYGYFDVISCGQFTGAVTYCNLSGGIVTLAAPAGYASYKWYKGPVITGTPIATAQVANIPAPATPTFYYCVLVPYNGNGCPDTIRTRSISNFTIHAFPDLPCNTTNNSSVIGVTVSGGIGGFNASWMYNPSLYGFSSGNFDTISIGHVAPIAGPFFFVVTVSDSIGCFRQDTVKVDRYPTFSINLGPNITTCLGTPIKLSPTLTPLVPGYTFTWQGKNVASTLSAIDSLSPLYTPTKAGYDTLRLRVDSGGCVVSDSMLIRTLPNTIQALDTAVCQHVIFNPKVTGDSNAIYTWSPVVGITPGQEHLRSPQITADTTRIYVITASYPGCPPIADTFTIHVDPQPLIELGSDTLEKCFFAALRLTAKITPAWFTNYTYYWRDHDGIDSINSPRITFRSTQDTTLLITVSTPAGCISQDSVRVLVYPEKFAAVTPSGTSVCPFSPIILSASGGISYLWRPGIYLNDTTRSSIVASPGANTDYIVYVTNKNGCVDTLPVSIKLFAAAVVSLPDSATLDPGASYQMHPLGNAVEFYWHPATGLDNPNSPNPVAAPSQNTRYFVTCTTEHGCVATDSIDILFKYDDTIIDMPNAFHPGATYNPEFKVLHVGKATLKSFRIYNRWGNKVFETTDINEGWNGQFNGVPQPVGVYMYVVEAMTNKGKTFSKQGNVTLLR